MNDTMQQQAGEFIKENEIEVKSTKLTKEVRKKMAYK